MTAVLYKMKRAGGNNLDDLELIQSKKLTEYA